MFDYSVQATTTKLVILGGLLGTTYIPNGGTVIRSGREDTFTWDPVKGLWEDLLPLNHAKSGFALVRVGNVFYNLGGAIRKYYAYDEILPEVESAPAP